MLAILIAPGAPCAPWIRTWCDRDAALIQLLDPPFDHSNPSPGYIQGYVRGVRENGGQYTHAAVWATMAFAALGDTERAWELIAMINPLSHASTEEGIAVYKSEPYVVASDVYAFAPHAGRGGWTWYTGSAGWMYRLILESLLGLTVESDSLRITPCIPKDWKSFKVHYRYHETAYDITVSQTLQRKRAAKCSSMALRHGLSDHHGQRSSSARGRREGIAIDANRSRG